MIKKDVCPLREWGLFNSMKKRTDLNIAGRAQVDRIYLNVVMSVDPEDWSKIRDETYWEERDALFTDREKKQYSVKRIIAWQKENGKR